jgi:hypothetical protein
LQNAASGFAIKAFAARNFMERTSIAAALLFSLLRCAASEQFIEITVKHEGLARWSSPASEYRRTNRCVIGTNCWMIWEGAYSQENTYVFDGSRLRCERLVTGWPFSQHPEMFRRNHPEIGDTIGQRSIREIDFADGTPLRTIREADAPWTFETKLAWLAFASSPFLRRHDRKLFPPDELWKHSTLSPRSGFIDETTLFDDPLGLPSKITLYTTNRQPLFEYVTTATTNFMGWTIPLRFHAAQYWLRPPTSNT